MYWIYLADITAERDDDHSLRLGPVAGLADDITDPPSMAGSQQSERTPEEFPTDER
jgi:hypothetical protein